MKPLSFRTAPPGVRYAEQTLAVLLLALMLTACGEDGVGEESAPAQPQTAAERGLAVATANGCTACHALDGTRGIGPGWRDSYGAMRTFKDGSSAVVDDAYLRRSIIDPAAEVVEGYDSIMLPAAVTEEQIADIIAMIQELRSPLAQ